jgi:predicted transcriptional regulator
MASRRTRSKRATAKKPRVIHTRVPVALEKELKRIADKMRMPVSNLIRSILEDALAMAETATNKVERELRSGAATLARGRKALRRKLKAGMSIR